MFGAYFGDADDEDVLLFIPDTSKSDYPCPKTGSDGR